MFNSLEKKILTILNENTQELFTEYDLVKKLYPNLTTADEASEFVNEQRENTDKYSEVLLSLSNKNLIDASRIVARDGQPSNLKITSLGIDYLESLTWPSKFKIFFRHPFIVTVVGGVIVAILTALILS